MTDLARPYRSIAQFGIWADKTADDYGSRDALAILAEAIGRTQDDDLRHDRQLLNALAYLIEHAGSRQAVIGRFRVALDVPHPVTRRRALADAYRAICAAVAGGR